MSELSKELFAEFESVANDAQALAFLPRDTTLQQEAVTKVQAFLGVLAKNKELAVSRQDDQSANTILSMELALLCVRSHIEMWVAAKEGAGEEAWDHLVSAQQFCDAAIRVRRQLGKNYDLTGLENVRAALEAIETTVFPPQMFMSPGGTIDARECSICGGNYDDCDHIKGYAYLGKQCHTIIRDFHMREVSFVTNPANKRARVVQFEDGGKIRNKMTWRLEEKRQAPDNLAATD